MRILTSDHPDAESTIILLNGKPMKHWISAQEGDPGWVEIMDIQRLAPLIEDSGDTEDTEPEYQELATKTIYGKVEFINIRGNRTE